MENEAIRNQIIGSSHINSIESMKDRIYKEKEYRLSRIVDALAYSLNEEIVERMNNQTFQSSLVENCLRKGKFCIYIDTCPLSQWPYKADKWEIPIHRLLSKYCFINQKRLYLSVFQSKCKQIRFEDIPLSHDNWIKWLQDINVELNWEKITRKVFENSNDFQNLLTALEKDGFSTKYSVHAEYKSIATITIS